MMNFKLHLKVFLMLILPLLVYYICFMNGLSKQIGIYAAITCWAIYLWTSTLVSSTMVGIFLPVAYLLSGVVSPTVVFSPWASTVPWFCLSGILIGQMLLKSGLAARLAYKCILLAGDSFNRILLGIMLAGLIIGPLIPTALGKMAIFVTLGIGVCEVLKLKPDSKESAALMLTCLFAVTAPAYAYLTGCVQIPAAVELMTSVSEIKVSWFDYLRQNFLTALLYSAICFLIPIVILKPKNIDGAKALVTEKYHSLGKVSLQEKKL